MMRAFVVCPSEERRRLIHERLVRQEDVEKDIRVDSSDHPPRISLRYSSLLDGFRRTPRIASTKIRTIAGG